MICQRSDRIRVSLGGGSGSKESIEILPLFGFVLQLSAAIGMVGFNWALHRSGQGRLQHGQASPSLSSMMNDPF